MRLLEYVVLFLETSHLVVFNEEIAMLGFSMSAIDLLLKTHLRLDLVNDHKIVRMRHAVIARFPRTNIVRRL